jgi:radical SAM protein with 4Fe4S-binding SPASM domain
MFRELSAPIAVQWETTSACPKKCFYCANHWRHSTSLPPQTANTDLTIAARVVDEVLSAKVFSVTITGGEPLLVLEHLAPELRRLAAAGVVLSLNSTLAGLTQELACLIKDLGIRNALVSIPSHDPSTDALITNTPTSWKRTAAGVALANQTGLRIEANMVVCRYNIHQIYETAKYAKQLGIQYFAATKMSHPSTDACLIDSMLSPTEFQHMAAQLKRVKDELGLAVDTVQAYGFCTLDDTAIRGEIPAFNKTCSAGKTFCMVSPTGEVRPCPLVSDSYGNVHTSGGLLAAWRAMKTWRDDSLLPSECRGCRHKSTCAGGCKADAKHSRSGYGHLDPYCNPDRIPAMPNTKRPAHEMPLLYTVNPGAKSRPEAFGGLLYVRGSQWCALDARLYAMLQEPAAVYSRDVFASRLGISPTQANDTMHFLASKNILVKSKN